MLADLQICGCMSLLTWSACPDFLSVASRADAVAVTGGRAVFIVWEEEKCVHSCGLFNIISVWCWGWWWFWWCVTISIQYYYYRRVPCKLPPPGKPTYIKKMYCTYGKRPPTSRIRADHCLIGKGR